MTRCSTCCCTFFLPGSIGAKSSTVKFSPDRLPCFVRLWDFPRRLSSALPGRLGYSCPTVSMGISPWVLSYGW
jgi:hypothetical protein